ncbi:MAG: hypothetical protein O2V44_00205 [Candidatus Bathyarchaeota archaeon]|nr:hypothetical protein [Candidatus Bathyarchaeota archaeon]
MNRRTVLIFTLVFCFSFLAIGVEGQPNYEVVAVYGSTPTPDGAISAGEWDDAASVSLNNTEVFVKQDGEYLYVAFNVSDSTLNEEDSVSVLFDIYHDGGTTFGPDDVALGISLGGEPTEIQLLYGSVIPFGWWAGVSYDSEWWQAEFGILYEKIAVTAGVEKSLGVAFIVVDSAATEPPSYYQYTWPPNLFVGESMEPPSKWGDMTSTGYNWIPEFPSFHIPLVFMVAALLAVLVYRRKHSMYH